MSVWRQRFAWARMNAYGVLIAVLCILASADMLEPDGPVTQRLGEPPPLLYAWETGFLIAGLLLMYGMFKADRAPEISGLAILNFALTLQVGTTLYYLGWETTASVTRLLTWLAVLAASWMRASTLMSAHGITVTIPPVSQSKADNEAAQSDRREGEAS